MYSPPKASLRRAQRLARGSAAPAVARVFVNDAAGRVEIAARNALAAMGDAGRCARCWRLCALLKRSRRSTRSALRRQVADAVLARAELSFLRTVRTCPPNCSTRVAAGVRGWRLYRVQAGPVRPTNRAHGGPRRIATSASRRSRRSRRHSAPPSSRCPYYPIDPHIPVCRPR